MKEVLCLATGSTYDIVLENCITAHPATTTYPRKESYYVVPIKKGGALEHLYKVDAIIECIPCDIVNYKEILSKEQYNRLLDYHKARKISFGYGKTDTKYRFYVLSRYADIEQPFYKKNIQLSVYMDLAEISLVR